MLKHLLLLLIAFYQRFLSPIKGYHCAHHRLHKGDTCSNAVKNILLENPISNAPTLVRQRFDECKQASLTLKQLAANQRADIPCDISCAGPDSCGGDWCFSGVDQGSNECVLPCDFCFDINLTKRRTQRIILGLSITICLALTYYYGSRLTKIELTPITNTQTTGLIDRISKRDLPALRVVLLSGTQEIESNIIETKNLLETDRVLLDFGRAVNPDQVNLMEIQDARFKAAFELVVVSQELDKIRSPQRAGSGEKYQYRFKTRWAFLNWAPF